MAKSIAYDAGFAGSEKKGGKGLAQKSLAHNWAERAIAWYRKRNESPIDRFVRESGGVMTDALEREISRRAGGSHGI